MPVRIVESSAKKVPTLDLHIRFSVLSHRVVSESNHPTRKIYNISITIWPGKNHRQTHMKIGMKNRNIRCEGTLHGAYSHWSFVDWFFSRFAIICVHGIWLMCNCIKYSLVLILLVDVFVWLCESVFLFHYFFNFALPRSISMCTIRNNRNKNMPRNPLHSHTQKHQQTRNPNTEQTSRFITSINSDWN